MLHWPLNGPHRVENHDMVNISVTTEHFTKEIRDFYAIVYANGLLRRLGISPSRYSAGGAKYAKAGHCGWAQDGVAKAGQGQIAEGRAKLQDQPGSARPD